MELEAASAQPRYRYPAHGPSVLDPSNGAEPFSETLRTYTAADMFDSEIIPLTANAAAATLIRFIATAAGGRLLGVDNVELAFTRP